MIAANLPDLDVLVFATSTPAVSFRRGWTHGLLAQALLPFGFLPACSSGIDCVRQLTPWSARPGRALLLISYVGVLSHVFLDYLNNYGVRLLMPFSGRWFYGDTLFIADVWMWLLLGLGVYSSRRRGQPARAARPLPVGCLHRADAGVCESAAANRPRGVDRARGSEPKVLMVGPLPVTPLSKVVIVDAGITSRPERSRGWRHASSPMWHASRTG